MHTYTRSYCQFVPPVNPAKSPPCSSHVVMQPNVTFNGSVCQHNNHIKLSRVRFLSVKMCFGGNVGKKHVLLVLPFWMTKTCFCQSTFCSVIFCQFTAWIKNLQSSASPIQSMPRYLFVLFDNFSRTWCLLLQMSERLSPIIVDTIFPPYECYLQNHTTLIASVARSHVFSSPKTHKNKPKKVH